jgi:hypothetical protein
MAFYSRGRPLPVASHEHLFRGIDYAKKFQWVPRPSITHVITVDMRRPRLRFLVTPPDDRGGGLPLRARTTSQFLQEFGAQVAINGDGVSPWWSHTPADFHPHVGDPVHPRGDAASRGRTYWTSGSTFPALFISSRIRLSFDAPACHFGCEHASREWGNPSCP